MSRSPEGGFLRRAGASVARAAGDAAEVGGVTRTEFGAMVAEGRAQVRKLAGRVRAWRAEHTGTIDRGSIVRRGNNPLPAGARR